MIKFNFQKTNQVPISFLKKKGKGLGDYLKRLREIVKERDYSLSEGFLNLAQEKGFFEKKRNFDLILVCGVGGSALGPKTVYQALKRKKDLKEILFFEGLNPLFLKEVQDKIKKTPKKKIALFWISKSGKTLESVVNFSIIFKNLKGKKPEIFVLTDKGSPLERLAKERGFHLFEIPKKVVGRFSVFSWVGGLPLCLAGVDVLKLFSGAKRANKDCLKEDIFKNPALLSALSIFYHYQKNKKILANLIFVAELETFGKWYEQLVAESLAKNKKGITPLLALGSRDLHSLGQLFFAGPKDKFFQLFFVKNLGADFSLKKIENAEIFGKCKKNTIWQIQKAIYQGVKRALEKERIPFGEVVLDKLDEEELGYLLESKMIEVCFLGQLMKVNAFNQPAVELYKKETRKILF